MAEVTVWIYSQAVRRSGDLAGVFEYDGETGYFYLYAVGVRVLDALPIHSGEPDFAGDDITIRWDAAEQQVGLFIRGRLWAVLDPRTRSAHGGNYQRGACPRLPGELEDPFPRTG